MALQMIVSRLKPVNLFTDHPVFSSGPVLSCPRKRGREDEGCGGEGDKREREKQRTRLLTHLQATLTLHITMWFLPESPRWLVEKDRQEEALAVLARVHSGGDVNDPYVQAEMAEIVAKITFEKSHPSPSYFDLLLGKQKRRMWIGIGVVSAAFAPEEIYKLDM
jgi:hypothetical protein